MTLTSSGTDGPWSLTATVTPHADGRRAIEAVVRDISPKDILLALRANGAFEADLPLSAILRAEIGPDGALLMAEGRVLERSNWSVVQSGALFAPLRATDRRPDWEGTGDDPWLRIERATFRRLPRSGAIVFTIRTLTGPLSVLDDDPEAAALLATAISELPDVVARYKFGPPAARAALLARLARS